MARSRVSMRKTHRNIKTTRKNRHNATTHMAHIIQAFFSMLMNIRLYHWSTSSYARHEGAGELYDALSSLIDQFVETYLGRYKESLTYQKNTMNIQIKPCNDVQVVELLGEYCHFLEDEVPKYVSQSDTDLLNIRYEILGHVNKTIYLFTLN
jgi:hypothetical protein